LPGINYEQILYRIPVEINLKLVNLWLICDNNLNNICTSLNVWKHFICTFTSPIIHLCQKNSINLVVWSVYDFKYFCRNCNVNEIIKLILAKCDDWIILYTNTHSTINWCLYLFSVCYIWKQYKLIVIVSLRKITFISQINIFCLFLKNSIIIHKIFI